jgi:hypothetical protein
LVAGAFGSLLVLPIAHAQDYEDMNNDANSIRQEQRNIQHDRNEQREDLERGDFGAAVREQAEIQQRRENQNATREDLNNDLSNRYYGDDAYSRHHYDRDSND